MKSHENIGVGIKPENRSAYQEVIREVALESGIHRILSSKKDDKESEGPKDTVEHKGIMGRLRSKLMTMAMAGFITLGGALGESYADQVRVAKEKGKPLEFSLETAITQDKLDAFERRLKIEEPEFIKWLNKYAQELQTRIEAVSRHVSAIMPETEEKIENYLRATLIEATGKSSDEEKKKVQDFFETQIKKDHEIVDTLKSKPELLVKVTDFFAANLRRVILSVVYLENSLEVRKNMTKFLEPPEITYIPHSLDRIVSGILASASAIEVDGKYKSLISLNPGSFTIGDEEVSPSAHINIFTHELIHTLNFIPDTNSYRILEETSFFRSFFEEGITQNLTLEIIQSLNSKDRELKPLVGISDYDQRLIAIAILDGIIKTGQHKNLLSLWHAGIINDDTLLLHLKETLQTLNLDQGIHQDLLVLNQEMTLEEYNKLSLNTLANLLSRLKISGVELSPEFLKGILSRGRLLADWQVKSVNETVSQELVDTAAKRHKSLQGESIITQK